MNVICECMKTYTNKNKTCTRQCWPNRKFNKSNNELAIVKLINATQGNAMQKINLGDGPSHICQAD
jgi:hypothetical protein